jgi:hypothetical protein
MAPHPARQHHKPYRRIRGPASTARTDALITETVGADLIVYDERRNHAHSLTPRIAAIWRACDGHSSPATIARQLELDQFLVDQALAELTDIGLIGCPGSGINRRSLLGRGARLGATGAIAAPLILTTFVPAALATVSTHVYVFFLGSTAGFGMPGTAGQTLGFYGNGNEEFTVTFNSDVPQVSGGNELDLRYGENSQDALSFVHVSSSPVIDYSYTDGVNAPVTGKNVTVTAGSPITLPFAIGGQIGLYWTLH